MRVRATQSWVEGNKHGYPSVRQTGDEWDADAATGMELVRLGRAVAVSLEPETAVAAPSRSNSKAERAVRFARPIRA